jgi:glycine betaine/proline transport system substrate-binding protein
MKRILLVLVVLAMAVAACGDDGGGGGTGEPDADKATITLVVNPWTASRLNAEVAKNIIESELGNPVKITEVNENDAMFTGMADGTLDAVLEIWPSGVTDAETAYFDEGTVVDLGELGAVGKIGWFVPQYVIDEHPELATWEGFADPELAALFATAETGELGRFLGTDPSYSQYDEEIIANLELPLQVVFSGSEPATVAEIDARVAAEEPIVLYWWTPTAAVAKYDLVNVALPEYTEECGASAAAGDGGVEDQLEMLPTVEIDGEDPAAVAAQWVTDHEDVWSAWLP